MPVAVEPKPYFESLDGDDRELLALLAAYSDATDESPLPWSTLNSYVQQLALLRLDGLGLVENLGRRGLSKKLALVANELINQGLVRASTEGLALTASAIALRADWNGVFKDLIEKVAKAVISSP